eukprot:c9664_g1_i4.p1 GENE.c9664_g1_i4~~c9664_g1_i4.p1  ORF type:complete len:530 (+),score=66.61 c9664_g1_i4:42-1631(+)
MVDRNEAGGHSSRKRNRDTFRHRSGDGGFRNSEPRDVPNREHRQQEQIGDFRTASDSSIRNTNHHIKQNTDRIKRHSLNELQRTLAEDAPRRPYYQRIKELRTTNHWGQRKLLLSEIEFLTLHGHESRTVLYAGAAPGTHIDLLAEMFPNHYFILVDPADFQCRPVEGRIEIKQEFFTEETARKYSTDRVLFICDIRTADPNAMEEEEVEDAVEADQVMQMKWHLLLNPARSMLKFRLPWGKGKTRYLDGQVFLPVWGRQTTTETRLVCTGSNIREYDHTTYEEQMFYFNTRTRVEYYDHSVQGVEGLCHCYDCAAEVLLLTNYLQQKYKFDRPEDVARDEVADFCLRLNHECSPSGARTLSVIIGHNQQWFEPRRYDPDNNQIIPVRREERAENDRRRRSRTDYTRRSRDGNHDVESILATRNTDTHRDRADAVQQSQPESERQVRQRNQEGNIDVRRFPLTSPSTSNTETEIVTSLQQEPAEPRHTQSEQSQSEQPQPDQPQPRSNPEEENPVDLTETSTQKKLRTD